MKERKIDVVVAGHICLDIIPEFPGGTKPKIEKLFIPGRLVNVKEAIISTGGVVSNTGLALHRLGMKVELMGKVGDDFFGKSYCGYLFFTPSWTTALVGLGARVVDVLSFWPTLWLNYGGIQYSKYSTY